MKHMYPLKFRNIYYEKPWGSNKLSEYRSDIVKENIGESWEIACHDKGMTEVSNGKFEGEALISVINKMKKMLLGDKIFKDKFFNKDFPLLIKLISAGENLSVQVHPNNQYAQLKENDNGKIEAWYILSVDDGAEIIVGTNGCTKERFKESCSCEKVECYMNRIHVKPGEIYLIEPGLLHSIGKGVILLEIQQNSDITYRVYDYNRGRQLHISDALKVIDFDSKAKAININKNISFQKCVTREGFNIDIYDIDGEMCETSDKEKFYIYTCVEGEGIIEYEDDGIKCEEKLSSLESVLIPAYLGNYTLKGKIKLIKSYV